MQHLGRHLFNQQQQQQQQNKTKNKQKNAFCASVCNNGGSFEYFQCCVFRFVCCCVVVLIKITLGLILYFADKNNSDFFLYVSSVLIPWFYSLTLWVTQGLIVLSKSYEVQCKILAKQKSINMFWCFLNNKFTSNVFLKNFLYLIVLKMLLNAVKSSKRYWEKLNE